MVGRTVDSRAERDWLHGFQDARTLNIRYLGKNITRPVA
jgi:hypothetical protein